MTAENSLERRLDAIQSRLEIGQLPIRYAMAVDSRDVGTWVRLFIPDVKVTRETSGRDALHVQIDGMLRSFKRSVHQICGQRIVLGDDPDVASGCKRHWNSADINEHPQSVGFDSWTNGGPPPALPDAFPTWHAFRGAPPA